MKPRTKCRFASLAIALLLVMARAMPADGQSLSSLQIGDPATKLAALGKPVETSDHKGMTVQRWVLPNGNDLSVTTSHAGKIVYIESDWNAGADKNPMCDLSGLQFGQTTLTELRKRFGSNGISFKERSGQMLAEDGAVMLNSYEAGSVVVSFYNKVSNAEVGRLDPDGQGTMADHARLDAISIADADYAKSQWGDRIYDPQYKKVDWK
jgi:hypothetical protein